jgi:hypothetical protein
MSQPIEQQRLGELAAELQKGSVPDRREPDIREKPTFVQWAGVRLLGAVLGLIALLVIVLLVYLAVATPSITAFGSPVTADSFALYQKTSDVVFQRVTSLVDQIVIKTLVPILTLLLGYVFGARAGRLPPEEGNR